MTHTHTWREYAIYSAAYGLDVRVHEALSRDGEWLLHWRTGKPWYRGWLCRCGEVGYGVPR